MFRDSPHLGQSGVGGGTGVMDTSCVRVARFLYRKFERIRASAERERRSQWHHAVAEESESLRTVLQCSGHPISHSTKSGLSRIFLWSPLAWVARERCRLPRFLFSAFFLALRSCHSLNVSPVSLNACGVCQSRCEFGALGEDGGPSVGVSGSRWKRCARMSSGSPNPFPFLPFAFSRALRAVQFSTDSSCCRGVGVGHCGACLPRSAFTGTVCDEVPSL